MDFYEQAAKAVNSPIVAPQFDNPAIASYFRSDFAGAPINAIAQAHAGVAAEEEERNAALRRQAAAGEQDMNEKIRANAEGKGWKKIKKEDGGFDYEDALGNKVDLWTFSKYTQKNPRDLLEDSDNMLDRQFIQDWDDTQEMMSAYASGRQEEYWEKVKDRLSEDIKTEDTEAAVTQLEDATAQLRSKVESGGGPSTVLQRFKQYYPNVFGQSGRGQVGNRFSR